MLYTPTAHMHIQVYDICTTTLVYRPLGIGGGELGGGSFLPALPPHILSSPHSRLERLLEPPPQGNR